MKHQLSFDLQDKRDKPARIRLGSKSRRHLTAFMQDLPHHISEGREVDAVLYARRTAVVQETWSNYCEVFDIGLDIGLAINFRAPRL